MHDYDFWTTDESPYSHSKQKGTTSGTQPIFTVSELNRSSKEILETAFPRIWVEGELSNVAKPSSGHIYFSLKDAKAQVRCAFFKGRNNLKFNLVDGQHVVVKAKVSLFEPRGDYQLIIENIELAGEGALRQAFEALKLKLQGEGLFDISHKKTIPAYPNSIGVITSPSGAAIRDILTVLKRRYPIANVCIYPSEVQGKAAASLIVKAIQLANRHAQCDVLIVARGGGSLEDLCPFNEEIVARAIYDSKLPIISGVGHETDITIADFVADLRAPTPTAAAEHATPDWQNLMHLIKTFEKRIGLYTKRTLEHYSQILDHLSKRLQHPGQKIAFIKAKLSVEYQRLCMTMRMRLEHSKMNFNNVSRMLDAVSPLATLGRGYAIVTSKKTGEIILDAQKVKKGDKLEARVYKGTIECEVIES